MSAFAVGLFLGTYYGVILALVLFAVAWIVTWRSNRRHSKKSLGQWRRSRAREKMIERAEVTTEPREIRMEDVKWLDPEDLWNRASENLRREHHFIGGVGAALFASLLGAGLWVAVTVAIERNLGLMALVVGFLVGTANRTVGKGIDLRFGIAGAVLAFFGCGLGYLVSITYLFGLSVGKEFLEVLPHIDLATLGPFMIKTLGPMDFIFYCTAIYEGYKFSFRTITHRDIDATLGENGNPIEF